MGKVYKPESIRNVAILGHVGSGKTTLNEALLFRAKCIDKKGEVARGTTVSDYTDEEIKHNMSIRTSLSFIEWKEHKINLLDIPGSGDFSGEINPALRVAESCIVVIDAEFGIQIETEKHWQMANNFIRPRIIFINKIDKDMINHKQLLEKIEHNFKEPPVVPIQIPMGNGKDFKGIIDIIYHKAFFRDENGNIVEKEIPEEYMHIENNSSGYNKGKIAYGGKDDSEETRSYNIRANAKAALNRYGSGNVNYKEPKRVSIGGSTSAGYRSSVRKANTKVGFGKEFPMDIFDLKKSSKAAGAGDSGTGGRLTAGGKSVSGGSYAGASYGTAGLTASVGSAGGTSGLGYGVGDTVVHAKFGKGKVISIDNGTRDYMVTVTFDEYGLKKMLAGFAKLKKA